ncbi:MAG: hypothetical protein COZ08_06615 [Bacteroidetes bacterium CG_4_10_14_3_um_filter_42_6]|nr:MAG: hypothetical protein COZ08_06615 [Bacteroidetes bacterium CG_4_10_14_3_um_filter_42_6]PJB59926.1 MAG: hypothetical protein CO098_00775 [Bacteroidetes bacterium CG_4_9_14_3_um_filter_41_19]
MDGKIIYEVIRVINNIPLFLEEHFLRFQISASILQIAIPEIGFVKNSIRRLIETNNLHTGNIRYQISVTNKKTALWDCWITPHHYPDSTQVEEGVKTGLYQAIRPTPNVKLWYQDLRLNTEQYLKENGFSEVLLTNNEMITEGSRSNCFFVSTNQIFTPESYLVLPGVTRNILIKLIQNMGITLVEKQIHVHELNRFQSAFLTSTSFGVLSIQSIDNQSFLVNNPIIHQLHLAYQVTCENDLKHFVW